VFSDGELLVLAAQIFFRATKNVTKSEIQLPGAGVLGTTFGLLPAMSFLRGGAPAPSGGVNTDKIEMAITE
jgi:hypothetical protein